MVFSSYVESFQALAGVPDELNFPSPSFKIWPLFIFPLGMPCYLTKFTS